jgi:hypothetical protein
MTRDGKVFLYLGVVVIWLLGIETTTMEYSPRVYAHYFTSDQSAQFLSLIHQINAEIDLINETFPSEIGFSYYHAKNAADLMNRTYHLTNAINPVDFRIIHEEEQLNNNDNSTIQALVVANIVDEILRKYGVAFDVKYDLTNMSNMLITQSINAHEGESHSNSIGDNDGYKLILVNVGDYQSAQALSRDAIKIFETKLSPLTQIEDIEHNSGIASVSKVKGGLIELNNMVNNKALPEDIIEIVHERIHPSLQLAYNLEIRR